MKKILVVEDNDAIRRLLEKPLTVAGYQLSMVASGEAALKYFEEGNRVDLVLTDVRLPGISGLEFLRIALDNGHLDNTRVVVMSSDDGDAVQEICRTFGAPFLSKPFKSINYEVLPTLAEALRH